MERGETQNITLDDIETMIKILERFVKLSREAQRVLRSLAPMRASSQHDFMQMFMQMALEQKMGGILSNAEEVSEEELDEETKRVIDKIRAMKQNNRQNV
jgi:hypothetical protein